MNFPSRHVTSKVAVLDDDPDAVASIAAILNQRGLLAVSFTSAEEVARCAQQERFSAYVLDWLLGNSTAVSLIATLRSKPESAEVPIFLLSGNLAVGGVPSDPDLAAAIQQYRLEYRAKPYSMMKLAQDLSNALKRTTK